VSQPYTVPLLGLVLVLVWNLCLTLFALWLWFTRDSNPAQTGKTTQTRKRPEKPGEGAQEPRKPPGGLPVPDKAPPTVLDALKGSGPLPVRDRPPPPPPPRQWLDEHQPTTDMRAVQPETNPEPATEQIRPSRRPAGQWAEDQHGNWSYNPEERK
jgi:hypothetical protein